MVFFFGPFFFFFLGDEGVKLVRRGLETVEAIGTSSGF